MTKRITQGVYEDIYTSIDKLFSSNIPTRVTAIRIADIPLGIAFKYQEKNDASLITQDLPDRREKVPWQRYDSRITSSNAHFLNATVPRTVLIA